MNSDEHFDRLDHWLRLEAQAEASRMAEKRRLQQSRDAESTGESLLDLAVIDTDPGIGGRYLVTFAKRNRQLKLPWNRLKVGAPIQLSRFRHDDPDSQPGVVSRNRRDSIQLSLNRLPDGDSFRIDLAADEITRRRCQTALQTARQSRGRLGQLRKVLMGESTPEFNSIPRDVEFQSPDLNQSQRSAVEFCLAAQDIALIHGPPGTGKTTTVVELIIQAIQRGEKVLACAPSNTAVDNLVTKLYQQGLFPVRLGHPARVANELQSRTLDSLAADDPNMRVAKEMFREAEELLRRLDRYTRAKPDRDARKEMRQQARQLQQDARLMEKQAVAHVLDQADLVCATTTIDDGLLGERWYDLLVIDEACQSTEPACWIPICRCDRVVLAGDHCQLPPTVISQQAAREGFDLSLMERQVQLHQESISRMLNVQYRMNDAIMKFSSQQFYDGGLMSAEDVASHRITDIYPRPELQGCSDPVQFIDTAGANWSEELEPDGESRHNVHEAGFVLDQVRQLHDLEVPLQDVAIIVPYAAQVRLLRDLAAEAFGQHHLEIDTVDGFQGREKEIVFISLVRSNDKCEIGFLSDTRRMNVAMTRARRRLVVVGDSATIGADSFYRGLLEYFEKFGRYSTVWEFDISGY